MRLEVYMAIITVETKISYKYLMGKTKSELAYKVLELLDDLDRYQTSLANAVDEIRNWNGGDILADDIWKSAQKLPLDKSIDSDVK